jgi:hypothetical protein
MFCYEAPFFLDDTQAEHKGIYITSDDKPKEGDWFYLDDAKIIAKYINVKPVKEAKKIVLTTDPDLIKDGVQAIDNEFLEWFIANPSCEEVEVEKLKCTGQCWKFIESDYKKTCLSGCELKEYKIIIPQEELKTSEEWQKQFPNTKVLDPDGWDRKNYQYSWFEEKITLEEYTTRLYKSSVQGLVTQEEPKQIYYNTVGRENGVNVVKGQFNTQKEALDLANELNRKFPDLYYDWRETLIKEEPKQETLVEAAENYSKNWEDITGLDYEEQYPDFVNKLDFINGATWQAAQSQEAINKLISIIEWYDNESDVRPDAETFMWFEQFKIK